MTQAVADPTPRVSLGTVVGAASPSFLLLGALARLPLAMYPLGVLLLVADRTGSYGQGGLAVAALSLGGAVGGPLVGVLSDRLGQRPVALVATGTQLLALAGVLLIDADLLPTMALVAVAGLANPQPGAMARTRWSAYGRRRDDGDGFVSSAMAYEGAVDEVSFVLGPAVVGTLAALVSPTTALASALVIAAVAQVGFGLHGSALPGRALAALGEHVRRAPLPYVAFGALLLATGSVGLVFGVTQTGVAARLSEQGADALVGVVYGLMGVGSAITALLTTRLPARITHEARITVSGVLLIGAGGTAVVAHPPLALAGANLLLGVALAPALISTYALAERIAPPGWSTTAMTALATANVVGVAAGAAVAGLLVDDAGAAAALAVDSLAGALVLVGGLTVYVSARRRAR